MDTLWPTTAVSPMTMPVPDGGREGGREGGEMEGNTRKYVAYKEGGQRGKGRREGGREGRNVPWSMKTPEPIWAAG